MTREEAAKWADLFTAFAEGKSFEHVYYTIPPGTFTWKDYPFTFPGNPDCWRIKPDLPPKPTQEKLDEWDRDLKDEAREPTDADEWVDQDATAMQPRLTAHLFTLGSHYGGKRWILKERVKKLNTDQEELVEAVIKKLRIEKLRIEIRSEIEAVFRSLAQSL